MSNKGASAPEKITAAHIRAGLRKMFPHPECGIVFEVAQATGFNAHRHLDAIAMDTWPSRGLIISGIEIKVSRSDFRRELAEPEKAEQMARFCDLFYIAAPPDLIKAEELPHAWGLLEGGQHGMRVKKKAAKTKAQPITREFLAAVFRAAGRSSDADDADIALAQRQAKLEGEHADRVKREAERLSTNNTEDARAWRALLDALGESAEGVHRWAYQSENDKLIAVIKAVKAAGTMEQWNGLAGLLESVAAFHDRLKAAAAILHAPIPDTSAIALGRHSPKRKK